MILDSTSRLWKFRSSSELCAETANISTMVEEREEMQSPQTSREYTRIYQSCVFSQTMKHLDLTAVVAVRRATPMTSCWHASFH